MSNKRFALILANQLANPHRQWIGLIDAGVQAESYLRAFKQCYPLQKARFESSVT